MTAGAPPPPSPVLLSARGLRLGAFASGWTLAYIYLSLAHTPNEHVVQRDQRYARLDRAVERVLDPLQEEYGAAVRAALERTAQEPLNWLVASYHFEASGHDNMSYLAREMAYLQSGGALAHWTRWRG